MRTALPSFTFTTRRLQRRLSVLLSMVVCLWMLGTATHFHLSPDDPAQHHTAKELCGFCVSLSSAGAAPAVRTFVPISATRHLVAPTRLLPEVSAAPVAAYRSRAPPLA